MAISSILRELPQSGDFQSKVRIISLADFEKEAIRCKGLQNGSCPFYDGQEIFIIDVAIKEWSNEKLGKSGFNEMFVYVDINDIAETTEENIKDKLKFCHVSSLVTSKQGYETLALAKEGSASAYKSFSNPSEGLSKMLQNVDHLSKSLINQILDAFVENSFVAKITTIFSEKLYPKHLINFIENGKRTNAEEIKNFAYVYKNWKQKQLAETDSERV